MRAVKGFYSSERVESQSFTFYPASLPSTAPLVIYVHGGAWLSGSKDSFESSPNGIHRLREFFTKAGFATAAINYRLSGEAQFPAQIHDLKAAIAYFRTHCQDFNIDSSKIVVVGGSAGGHLAMLAAGTGSPSGAYYEGNVSVSTEIVCAVSIYGVSDLRTIYDDRELCGFPRVHPEDVEAEAKLLGGSYPAESDTAAATNWIKAQPLGVAEQAEPAGAARFAPLFLLHGLADSCVPSIQSTRMYDALQNRNIKSEILLVPDAEHADIRCYSDENLHQIVEWVRAQVSI